jgi:FtsZ-interacting cell division protein ZipA
MDKRTVSAFVIIGVILIAWLIWSSNMQKKQLQEKIKTDTVKTLVDTVKKEKKEKIDSVKITLKEASDSLKSDTLKNTFGNQFYKNSYINQINTPEGK